MAIRDRLRAAADALLGVSAYQAPSNDQHGWQGPRLEDATTEQLREAMGGQLQPLPSTKLRWYVEDLETAQRGADAGYMRLAAQLMIAARRDGFYKGLMGSRTKGLTRLPKRFYGDAEICDVLKARNGTRSVFDEMFPPAELALLDKDGIELGIGVAELVPVEGRSYPVLVRLDPQYLVYRWQENRWYFNSIVGLLPITPGDGRWILHVPGGRLTPWNDGLWAALGRSFINKEHAVMHRANYGAKLANPARVAYTPAGATETQRLGFFRRIMAWGTNTVFELPPGWEAKLLESNGRGWEVFQRQIDTSDLDYMINIAGQMLTTKGGTGFDGQDVAEAIRQDLIQADGDALAYTINTQGLPQFIVNHYGESRLAANDIDGAACAVEWDTGTNVDKERETRTLGQSADAISRLSIALAPYNLKVNIVEMATRFAIPTLPGAVVAIEPPAATSGEGGAGELKEKKPEPKPAEPTDGDDVDLAESA